MGKNIGIDFGTTNTIIYTRDANGKIKKIGGKSIRSAVYFRTRDDYVIGDEAIRCSGNFRNSQAFVTDFKTMLMDKISIVSEDGDSFKLKGETIARLFLSKVLSDYVEIRLKKFFGNAEMGDGDKTVITVPAKFDAEKKAKIKKAATNAMFSNAGIAYEPTAAAVAALDTDVCDDIIAVYDFGGGTFDVSVIEKGLNDHYYSVNEDGDPNLGGNRITEVIADQIILPMIRKQGFEIYADIDDMEFDEEKCMSEDEYLYNIRTIHNRIEEIKVRFSEGEDEYNDEIPIRENNSDNCISLYVTKSNFDEVIRPYVQRTVDITRRVIEKVMEKKKFVRKIVMAGGSSQLTLAEKLLKEEFENDGIEIVQSDNVFDLIAKGALLMAEQQKLIRVEEKTNTQFGIGVLTGLGIKKFEKLIDVNVPLPVSSSKTYKIDNRILELGSVDIPCYEKDVNNYPDSKTERDKGISLINTYKIDIDKKLQPNELTVTFTIECDGTLNLSVHLFDSNGKEIKEYDAEVNFDNDVE